MASTTLILCYRDHSSDQSQCSFKTWDGKQEHCEFGEKSAHRSACSYFQMGQFCQCMEAQKACKRTPVKEEDLPNLSRGANWGEFKSEYIKSRDEYLRRQVDRVRCSDHKYLLGLPSQVLEQERKADELIRNGGCISPGSKIEAPHEIFVPEIWSRKVAELYYDSIDDKYAALYTEVWVDGNVIQRQLTPPELYNEDRWY